MERALTDYQGTVHSKSAGARILSLVPSLTELVFDLGLAGNLVGRTHYCIHPTDRVETVPSVGGTKKIKMDRARELAPTHALVNVDENPKEMADALRELGVSVIVTHPMHPDQNIDLYRLIGSIFGAEEKAADLIKRYEQVRLKLSSPDTYMKRRALYLIWKDPWMAISADTYIANMLGLVNWHVVTPGADPDLKADAARYPEVKLNDRTLDGVDLVLFSTEPYAFDDNDLKAFKSEFPRHATKAHLIDGEMTSWYGSRAIPGLDYLCKLATTVTR